MEIDPELLRKYGKGACTPEELRLVEDWLEHEGRGARYELVPGTVPGEEKARLLGAVNARLGRKKRRVLSRPVRIAALWLLAAGLGFYFYSIRMTQPERVVPESRSVEVPRGKKMSLVLPDGSKVYLNAGSTLVYPEEFESSRRLLKLDGEAFFEVVRKPNAPFVVETGDTRTEVLGTRFNLKSFQNEGNTRLTVAEGRVMFTATGSRDTLLLTAGRRASYREGRMRMEEVKAGEDNGWTRGRLLFNHRTIAEMIPVLERWYDVRISVRDPGINAYRVRGRYENPSLRHVLEDLASITDIRFTIEGKNVILYR